LNFQIVSYYTKNTPYENEYKLFKSTLINQKIDNYKIYAKDSLGSWENNTQIKASIILDAMKEFDKPILWIDIDARIRGGLNYFNELSCDVCCYYLKTNWNHHELLSGTIYFGNTKKAKTILEKWIKLNNKNSEWDQRNLQSVIDNTKCNKTILPSDYIVVDKMGRFQRDINKIVIYHTQASRRNKRLIK